MLVDLWITASRSDKEIKTHGVGSPDGEVVEVAPFVVERADDEDDARARVDGEDVVVVAADELVEQRRLGPRRDARHERPNRPVLLYLCRVFSVSEPDGEGTTNDHKNVVCLSNSKLTPLNIL